MQTGQILSGGRLAPAARAAIESIAKSAGNIDILRIATGDAAAVLDGIAAVLPQTRSLFLAGVPPADRRVVAACLKPTHVGWLPDLDDSQSEPMRFARRDLLAARATAAPDRQTC